MATITASPAGGNWSSSGSWVGGVIPNNSSDVLLTATSGSIVVDGISISPSECKSIDCTGFANVLSAGSLKTLNIGGSSAGNAKFPSGANSSFATDSLLNFVSTSGTTQITFNGTALGNVVFNGVGGSWQLQDSPGSATTLLTVTAGTLNFNNISCTFQAFNSSGSTTRTVTMGSGTLTLQSAGTSWDTTTTTNLTFNANTSTVSCGGGANDVKGGGLTFNNFNYGSTNAGTCTLDGANTFANLTFNGGANKTNGLQLKADQTVTGTFTFGGGTVINRSFLSSSVIGTRRTVTVNTTNTIVNADFRDIVGAGSASWNLASISGNSGDATNNSGITFTTPATSYWVVSGGTSTGSFSAVTRWASASNGTAGTGRAPLPQDTSVFDSHSIDGGARTITLDMPRIGAVNWTGVTNTPLWTKSTACEIYGSLTMVAGMTNGGTTGVSFANQDAGQSFTSGAVTFTNPIECNNVDQSLTTQDNLVISNSLTITSGTMTSAAGKTISVTSLSVNGGTLTPTGNVTLTTTLTTSGAGNISASSYTFTGGTTANFGGSGTVTIDGWSGSSLTISGATFTSGTTRLTCSSTCSMSSGTITIGSGGISATTYTFGTATARTINMGSGTWTATSTGTIWNYSGSNVTWNKNTSTIAITNTSASTKTFTGNGGTYGNLTVSGAASNGTVTVGGANTFDVITLSADASFRFPFSATTTVSGFVATGSSGHVITIVSTSAGTFATLSCPSGTISCDWLSLKDNHAVGGAAFYAGANSTSVSGNTGWIFTAPPVATNSFITTGMY